MGPISLIYLTKIVKNKRSYERSHRRIRNHRHHLIVSLGHSPTRPHSLCLSPGAALTTPGMPGDPPCGCRGGTMELAVGARRGRKRCLGAVDGRSGDSTHWRSSAWGTNEDAKAAGEEFGRGGGRMQGGEARRRGLRETGREEWHQCTATMAKAPRARKSRVRGSEPPLPVFDAQLDRRARLGRPSRELALA
jgi:hypothetical protein